LIVPLMVSMA